MKGGRLAFPPPGAAVWSGGPSGSSARCWDPAAAAAGTEARGPAGRGTGWGTGPLLLGQAWREWGSRKDPV